MGILWAAPMMALQGGKAPRLFARLDLIDVPCVLRCLGEARRGVHIGPGSAPL